MPDYQIFLLTKSKISDDETEIIYEKLIAGKENSLIRYIEREAKSDFPEYFNNGIWGQEEFSVKWPNVEMCWSYESLSIQIGEESRSTIDEILID